MSNTNTNRIKADAALAFRPSESVDEDDAKLKCFVEEYSNFYADLEKLYSGSIYDRAKLRTYMKNWERFPYRDSEDELTEEEKDRIRSKGASKNLHYSQSLNHALSSEMGWYLMVHPEVEKQVYQEKTLFEHSQKVLPDYKIINLPSGGSGAMYLANGEIITGLKNRPKNYPKSLDFEITAPNGEKFYVVAKYTMGDGGSQDNQRADARLALEHMRKDSDARLVLILDGTHYQKTMKSDDKTRMESIREELTQKGLDDVAYAGTHEEALDWIMLHA